MTRRRWSILLSEVLIYASNNEKNMIFIKGDKNWLKYLKMSLVFKKMKYCVRSSVVISFSPVDMHPCTYVCSVLVVCSMHVHKF